MTLEINYTPAGWSDFEELTKKLRERDALSFCRVSPLVASFTFLAAEEKIAVRVDNSLVCIVGVDQECCLTGRRNCWILTGPFSFKKLFARKSKELFNSLRQKYRGLCGMVESDYAVSVRWLKWLGFVTESPVIFQGVRVTPFRLEEL